MDFIPVIIFAAVIFGLCFGADFAFRKLFRSRAQHASGKALRASKHYGSFGLIFTALGFSAMLFNQGSWILAAGGVVVVLLGAGLMLYYLSFGIFYDDDSFLVSGLFKKSRTYSYSDICSQQLYVVTGGSVLVELSMADGKTVNVQTTMNGAIAFLDAAFAGWCLQTGRDPDTCDFHDPENSCWFPKTEEH